MTTHRDAGKKQSKSFEIPTRLRARNDIIGLAAIFINYLICLFLLLAFNPNL